MTLENEPAGTVPPAAEDVAAAAAWKEFETLDSGKTPDTPAATGGTEPPAGAETVAQSDGADTTSGASGADSVATSGQTQTDELWSTLTDAQRTALEALRSQHQETDRHYRSLHGKLAPVQRENERLKRELDSLRKGEPTTPAKPSTTTAALKAKVTEKIGAISQDLPEVAGPLGELFSEVLDHFGNVEGQVTTLSGRATEADLEANSAALNTKVPGYIDLAKREDFGPWLAAQSRAMRRAYEENAQGIVDVDDAAMVMSAYRASLPADQQTQTSPPPPPPPATVQAAPQPAPLSARRQEQLTSAAAPRTAGPARVTDQVPDDREGAWKYFERLDAAKSR